MMGSMRGTYGLRFVVIAILATTLLAAGHKEFRYTVGKNANVNVVNQFGPVTVKTGPSGQVVISTSTASDKVEVDSEQHGKRVEARTHFLQDANEKEGRVEYEVTAPTDATVNVQSATGPIQVSGIHGEVTLKGDSSPITVRDLMNTYLHVRNVSGPVTLTNINGGHIDVVSTTGKVMMTGVNGPVVSVNTASGDISYDGDFGNSGDYTLSNHSGNIDVSLPAAASVDLTARSIKGEVQNDFPLQDKPHVSFTRVPGHAFTGTSNSGSSWVKLSSFGGTIRVKKR